MKIIGIIFMIIAGGGLDEMISDMKEGRDLDEVLFFSVIMTAVTGIAFIMI